MFSIRTLVSAAAMASVGLSQPVVAIEIEEIIVTARKRQESLQEVPIAITAITGRNIEAQGLSQLEGLSEAIPLFTVSENIGTDTMSVRGIGSGNNFGFEQAVGQVVDGFFYGRSRLTRLDFLDVERVEVLKGPQGALIGKNTTAGVINITNAKPTEEFEAWGSTKYINYKDGGDGGVFEGAVSGPLSESLRARLALRFEDTEGWVENPLADQDQPARDNWMGRLSMDWSPAQDWRVAAHWTHSEQEIEGSSVQLSNCGPAMTALVQSLGIPVNENCGNPDNKRYSLAPRNGQGNFDISSTDLDIVGVTIDWDIGRHTITSLTGYAEFEAQDTAEGDRLPIEYGIGNLGEDYEQWSQELRLTSDTGGTIDYIAGIFYQHREQVTTLRQDIAATNCIGCGMLPPMDFSFYSPTDEETDTYAVFGQLSWHINDQWTVTVDGRYTYEEKKADKVFYPSEIGTTQPLTAFPFPLNTVFPFNVFTPAQLFGSHVVSQDRDEDNFSPGLAIRWIPANNLMFYGSIRQGFKGGGFDHLNLESQATVEEGFQFEDEEVISYELGAKMMFAEGRVQLNASIFYSEFDDLQVSTINQKTVPAFARVSNAAEATTQGVEIDVKWLPVENLRLSAALGYLDAEFDDYSDAVCYFGQTVDLGCDPGPDGIPGTVNPMFAADDTQDLKGQPLEKAPEWTAVLAGEYTWSLTNEINLRLFVQGIYSDEFYSAIDLDPVLRQEAYWKFNAQLALAAADDRWEISLIGRNLGDKKTSTTGNDLPGGFLPHGYERFLDPTQSIAVRGIIKF